MSASGEAAEETISRFAQDVAEVGEVLSDPRRVAALLVLRRGPVTVNELSHALDLAPAQASLQLGALRRLRAVSVLRSGRHRIYSIDSDIVTRLLEVVAEVATGRPGRLPEGPTSNRRLPPPGSDLRQARTCLDHLAGATAVEFAQGMERAGWTIRGNSEFLLTQTGEEELVRRGVDVGACRETRRKFAPGCVDWTERRLHIGGALGAALLRALREDGFLEVQRGRVVRIRRPLDQWLKHRPL